MTQQEEQLLNGLIQRVNGTQLQTKDDDAERLLQSSFARNPDAVYILCQTVLVQQFAMEKSQNDLQAAREEIQRLQQQSGEKHGSFLGNLLGLTKDEASSAPAPPVQQPSYSAPTGYQPVNSAPPVQYGYPPQQQYPPYPPQSGYYQQGPPPPTGGGMFGGGGGFLQGAMQTAAGVVAGEMAFRALEDVFSSHNGRGFEGGSGTVNNFYEDAGSRDSSGGFGDRLAAADGYDGGISSDIEDRRGEASGFFDGGSNDSSANFDDASSFDDGGSSGNDDD